jgi:hypothetical protein
VATSHDYKFGLLCTFSNLCFQSFSQSSAYMKASLVLSALSAWAFVAAASPAAPANVTNLIDFVYKGNVQAYKDAQAKVFKRFDVDKVIGKEVYCF